MDSRRRSARGGRRGRPGDASAGRPSPGPSRIPAWLPPAAAVAVCLVFAAALGHPFAWDDHIHLRDNPHLNPPTWAGLRALWAGPFEDLYSPLVYTAWAALAAVARGPDGSLVPWPFHALCLGLHALNVLLVFGLARRLLGETRAAAFGAALFALHPLQVEPVVWASGLKDVLCGTFALGALLALASAGEDPAQRRRATRTLAGATALYLLALLTKPAAVALPLVALGLERLALQRPWRRALITFGVWALLAAPMAYLTGRAQPLAEEGFQSPVLARPVVALDAIGFYLAKLLLPATLAIDYGRTPLEVLDRPGTFAMVCLALAALALCVWAARRQRLVGAAGIMFVGPLLPVLGFVPFVFQYISTVADRYAYLALLGPAVGLGLFLRGRGTRPYVAVGLVLAALGVRSAVQSRVWADEITLFRHTIAHNPRSYIGQQNLSYALHRAGRLPEAIEHARRAEAIAPHPPIWYHLGALLLAQGRAEEAERYLRKALEGDPRHARAHFTLGLLLQQRGDHDQAARHLQAAAALDPTLASPAGALPRR